MGERDVKEGVVTDRTGRRGSMTERGEDTLEEEHQEDEVVDVVATEVTEVVAPHPEETETRTDTLENNFRVKLTLVMDKVDGLL